MNKSDTAIEVRNLKKSYKKVEVLRDVSFSVKKGSIFALLGPNGAGKTTTINILTTLIDSDSGLATVDGYDVATDEDHVRNLISLSGQFVAVDDLMSARENLKLIADLRHVTKPKDVVNELLKKFELEKAADRRVQTFSGGMRRRLDIAMSLIGNPSIIFFDEPTTGLDPKSRNGMWETIRSLANGGTTIFLTTQYLEEADRLADKIAILHNGVIVAEGTALELKNRLPHGHVELTLRSEKDMDAAAKQLKDYTVSAHKKALQLSVATDGSVSHLTRILTILKDSDIDVIEFAQKAPSLDDVFLEIIREDKEEKS